MLDMLLQWDYSAFLAVNPGMHHPWLDAVMPWLRNKYFWAPLYVGLALFLWINLRGKGLWIIVGAVVAIAMSDTISSKVLKPLVQRERPCRDVWVRDRAEVLVPCGGGYSFPSSHATNHFALAAYLVGTMGRFFRKGRYGWLVWAASVAFAQVYVGVHFPIDVLCGALLGLLIGWMNALVMRYVLEPDPMNEIPN